MPQLINSADDVVIEAVQGGCLTNPAARVLCPAKYPTVVVSKVVSATHVALLCGGGSGHEPAHAGFVGEGCLSAAVCGRVFASPPISHITAALDYLLGGKYGATNAAPGVLVMVKNYTGDVINFGAAVEAAKAKYGAHKVDMHVFGDDVAFGVDHDARRGVAGTVLWYRMVGRLAVSPSTPSLPLVKEFAVSCGDSIRTMGASVSGCVLPGNDAPNTTVDAGHVELGLGIHGEHGRSTAAFENISSLVRQLLAHIVNPVAPSAAGELKGVPSSTANSWVASVTGGSPFNVVVAVNNLGSCSELEMSVITRNVMAALGENSELSVSGVGCGSFCTSLNMHGFSITLVNTTTLFASTQASEGLRSILTTDTAVTDLLLTPSSSSNALLHRPTIVPFDGSVLTTSTAHTETTEVVNSELQAAVAGLVEAAPGLKAKSEAVSAAISTLLKSIASKEAEYNAFDAATGDGDTGTGARRAVEELLANPTTLQVLAGYLVIPPQRAAITAVFTAVGESVCDTFAGSMGALLSTFIIASGSAIAHSTPEGVPVAGILVGDGYSPAALRTVIKAGMEAVQRVGGAKEGDRTFLDVLFPIMALLDATPAPTPADIVRVAQNAAEAAAQLSAKKGRARYLGGKEVGHRDPGCEIIKDILVGMYAA